MAYYGEQPHTCIFLGNRARVAIMQSASHGSFRLGRGHATWSFNALVPSEVEGMRIEHGPQRASAFWNGYLLGWSKPTRDKSPVGPHLSSAASYSHNSQPHVCGKPTEQDLSAASLVSSVIPTKWYSQAHCSQQWTENLATVANSLYPQCLLLKLPLYLVEANSTF